MYKQSLRSIYATLGVLTLATSPVFSQDAPEPEKMHHGDANANHELYKLLAVIRPVADSKVQGTIVFEKSGNDVMVKAKIGGLEPNSKHGIHVHEFGDLGSPDATSAGGHFNPDGHDHALPEKDMRHAGDLGNLIADENGNAALDITVTNLTLDAGKDGILGRAVIIHAKEDDGGQPTGNAGDRIGAGVIGISKDAMEMPMGKDAESTEKNGSEETKAE